MPNYRRTFVPGGCWFFTVNLLEQRQTLLVDHIIKTAFAKSLPKLERLSTVRKARNERGIWQRRFWEHMIRDETDYTRHVEYCYVNPVKHGLATRVRDWPHSSFHRDVERGLFPRDWAGDVAATGEFGEAL